MIPEYVVEDCFGGDGLGGEEVGAEDEVDGGDGLAEVFCDQVGGHPGGEGRARCE